MPKRLYVINFPAIHCAIVVAMLTPASAWAECAATRGSALDDPDFPPPNQQKLVSSIGCREFDVLGVLRGIWVQTTAGDGSISLSNTLNISTPGVDLPTHPAAIHTMASPQFLEWKDFPTWGRDPITREPVRLLIWSSGPAPSPTDYYSGAISISNSGNITTTDADVRPIVARGSIGSVTINNSGHIDARGSRVGAIEAVTGVGGIAIADGGPKSWDWGLGDVYYPGGLISIVNSGNITLHGNIISALRGASLGGGVQLSNSGRLNLFGDQSIAMFALGARGNLSVSNSGAITAEGTGSQGLVATLFAKGNIDITNRGSIVVSGEEATGIRARAAEADMFGLETSANVSRITGNGAITATGEGATGIDVSQRGGAANVDYGGKILVTGNYASGINADTEFGSVNIKVGADVLVSGIGSYGVSVAGGTDPITDPKNADGYLFKNSGALSVEIAKVATVQGGSLASIPSAFPDLAAGVLFMGGTDNRLTNHGTITSASGIAVLAYEGTLPDGIFDKPVRIEAGNLSLFNAGVISGDIVTGKGNDTVTNSGTGVITGNIDLGGGTNSFTNEQYAIVNSRDRINVGTGNVFTNFGILSPGGLGTTQKTTITGNYVQAETGRLVVDINPSAKQTSDMLEVTGSAKLAGLVVPNIVDFSKPLANQYLIVSAAGIENRLQVLPRYVPIASTVGYAFGLKTTLASAAEGEALTAFPRELLYLTTQRQGTFEDIVAANVPNAGTNKDAMISLGKTLNQIEEQGGGALQPILTALRLQSFSSSLADALARLVPQSSTRQTSTAVGSNISVGNAMLSCASRDGEHAYTREDSCYYTKFTTRRADRDVTSTGAGSHEKGTEFLGGVQVPIWEQVRLGMALGFEEFNAKGFDANQQLSSSDGQRYSAGLVLKDQWGPVNAYLNLTGSWTRYEHHRYVNLTGVGGTAQGEQDVWSGTSRLRFSHLNDFGPWYFKPLIDFAASYTWQSRFAETGAGAANLTHFASKKWLFSVMPGAEIGGQVRLADGTLLRPYFRGGVIVFNDNSSSLTTTFTEAPAGVTPFVVTGKFDQIAADVDVGVHVLTNSGINVRLNYEGRYGETSSQHAGTAKLSVPLNGK